MVKKEHKVLTLIDQEYQEFLQMAVRSLHEHKGDQATFGSIVDRFGAKLRDPEFWVPVFQITFGAEIKVRSEVWLDDSTVEFFSTAYSSFPLQRQDKVLTEVANHLGYSSTLTKVNAWLVGAVKDKLRKSTQDHKIFDDGYGKPSRSLVVNAFIKYAQPSDVVSFFDRLANFFCLGATPEENSHAIRASIDSQINSDYANGRLQRWNVEGVHKVASEKRLTEIIDDAYRAKLPFKKLVDTHYHTGLSPTAAHKAVLTEMLLAQDFRDICYEYRKYPTYFEEQKVKEKMLELYKQEMESSPNDIVDMMMGKHPHTRKRGFMYHPLMFMGPPPPWMW